jgi:hypothetical protein
LLLLLLLITKTATVIASSKTIANEIANFVDKITYRILV